MRIAFLCKRRYMSKDVILDRYARLYEIPFQLASLGHDVESFCLSYQNDPPLHQASDVSQGSLNWHSTPAGPGLLPGLLAHPFRLLRQLRAFRPDVIIGASDIPHLVMGAYLAKRLSTPFVADLYDNFEGFGQAKIPGAVMALRRAVRQAELIITTSSPLKDLVESAYRPRGDVEAMPSTVDKAVFYPRPTRASRRALGLPENGFLIGTAGGLYPDKGIQALYDAWAIVEQQRSDVNLVLAGPTSDAAPPPKSARVHYLGNLAHDTTPLLFSALDVGVISVRDTRFGRYCFPQKAYEMLACELPVAAARVGAMTDLFKATPQILFEADNASDLAETILHQLVSPTRADVVVDDWRKVISTIEVRLKNLTRTQ